MPHVAVVIAHPWAEVHAYAADPAHLPAWAAGLARSSPVEGDDGWWRASSPLGDVAVRFCEPNRPGVLDHVVRLRDGEEVLNPMLVLPHPDGAEVVFTVRARAGTDADDLDRDVAAVEADLHTLRRVFEP